MQVEADGEAICTLPPRATNNKIHSSNAPGAYGSTTSYPTNLRSTAALHRVSADMVPCRGLTRTSTSAAGLHLMSDGIIVMDATHP